MLTIDILEQVICNIEEVKLFFYYYFFDLWIPHLITCVKGCPVKRLKSELCTPAMIDDQLGVCFSSCSCRMMKCGEATLAALMGFQLAQCGMLSKPGNFDAADCRGSRLLST